MTTIHSPAGVHQNSIFPEKKNVSFPHGISKRIPHTISHKRSDLIKNIWNIATKVLDFMAGVFFYWANSSIFAFSFMIGIIRNEDVDLTIKKIQIVWEAQKLHSCFLGVVGSFFALPVTLAVGSIIYAANLGSSVYRRAQEVIHEKPANSDGHLLG